EPCVYQKASGSNVTFLILYVHDIIIMGNHIPSLQSVKDYLGKCFAMKDLGEATFILGIKIYGDRLKQLIGLAQNTYMEKILKRYKMDNSKCGHIPMKERLDLNKTQGASTHKEVKRMQNLPYASAVGFIIIKLRKKIKALRSDRGGEYLSKNGIVQHLTSPYTPQQNESAVCILNMVPTKKVDKTPYEIWHGKVPNLSYLKVWGCEAYVKCDSADKLHQRSVKDLISQKFSGRENDVEDDHMDTLPSENTSKIPAESESLGSPPELIPIRRSERTTRTPNRICLNIEVEDDEVGDLGKLANYKAAMLDPDKVIWQGAMDEEMNSMKVMKVWIVVDLPPNAKVVRNIRAIRILIAITAYYDYEIWKMNVKTAFLNGCLDEDIYMEQPERIWEKLHTGCLDEDIYMEQPEGYVDPKYPNRVCKLQRSIYGLKQTSCQWNKRFDEEIKKFGFIQNRDEPCVYRKASGSDVVFLILYVDDILIMGNNIPRLKEVKDY
nr:hypothetical protein [Tanacetum cinerariifolium]